MSSKGLTTAEVLERAKQGKNVLTQGKKKSLFSVIAEQFASPLLLLLVAASVISIMTGEIVDGIIIIVVVLANVIIGTVQELSAEKSDHRHRAGTFGGEIRGGPAADQCVHGGGDPGRRGDGDPRVGTGGGRLRDPGGGARGACGPCPGPDQFPESK